MSPATVMALWVLEGKLDRNQYYHQYAALGHITTPDPRPTLRLLKDYLKALQSGQVAIQVGTEKHPQVQAYTVPDWLTKQLMKAYPKGEQTKFADLTKDARQGQWWEWSHVMPNFWSLDSAVNRFPQTAKGWPIPPSAHGTNTEDHFRKWLQALRAIHALDADADLESVLTYSAGGLTQPRGYQVVPVANASNDDLSEWRISIHQNEAHRVIPLHLYLMGAFFLDGKRRIAGPGDPAMIPDSAACAAYNAGPTILGSNHDPEHLRRVWESAVSATEAANFTKNGRRSVRVNVLLFRYIDEVLSQSIRLTDRR